MMITEIKLRCHELPPPESAVQCAHFNSVNEALLATQIAMRFRPYACELIDQLIIEGARRNIGQSENLDFVQGRPAAILVTQFRGDTVADVANQFDELKKETCKKPVWGRPIRCYRERPPSVFGACEKPAWVWCPMHPVTTKR